VEADVTLSFETDAADRTRRTFQKAEEQAEKVAAKLWFLDLKFSRFFTPKLVGAVWALYVCLVVVFFLCGIVYDVLNLSVLLVPFVMLVQFIALLFAVISARVVLEAILVIFRISEHLEALKHLEHLKHLADQGK
jgi:hypothetical protein